MINRRMIVSVLAGMAIAALAASGCRKPDGKCSSCSPAATSAPACPACVPASAPATKPAPAATAPAEPRVEGKTAKEWLATIGSGQAESKAKVREAVDSMGAAAVPALIEALRDSKEPAVREFAAFALGRIGGPAAVEAVPLLAQHTRDSNFLVIEAAETALSVLGASSPRAVALMVEALKSPDAGIRKSVVAQLGACGAAAKGVLPAIEKLKTDPDAGVREAAEEAAMLVKQAP